MSVVSKWLEKNTSTEAIASLILNILFTVLSGSDNSIEIYLKNSLFNWVLVLSKVDKERPKDTSAFLNIFFAFKDMIVRVSIKSNK